MPKPNANIGAWSDLKLREAVAVQIMGLKAYRARRVIVYLENDESDEQFEAAPDGDFLAVNVYTLAPAYEVNIGVAWRVVERMREKGYRPTLYPVGTALWGFEFAHPKHGDAAYVTVTAPEAICRAAVAAIGASHA